MQKTVKNGVKNISFEGDGKFINFQSSLMVAQALQLYVALQGYIATVQANQEQGEVELKIYFSDKPFPQIPTGFVFSRKEINSHEYWSEYKKEPKRMRTLTYYYYN